ncbi:MULTISPECIES: hypothetical protein [Pseudomonas]|uniref:hypothetical protein n=1 Tax=Pseudomonas TaxID=286 RepID=UPI000A868BC9|nr:MULTISPECIES: hypothetical protein [Pseudomonas]
MKCYLCGLEGQEAEPMSGGELVSCQDCGVYRISGLVLKELGAKQIDYLKMREDLHRQRQDNATSIAEINTETAIWRAGS